MTKSPSFETMAIHGGEGERHIGDPVTPAPVLSTTYFTHPDAVGFSATDLKADAPHFYTRWSNPTLDLLEQRLALLEGGEAAVSFASGMAAISVSLRIGLAGVSICTSRVLGRSAAATSTGFEASTIDTLTPCRGR